MGRLEETAPKPSTLEIILLDEISGKLSDLIELIQSTIPEGRLVPIKIDLKANDEYTITYDRYAPKPFYSVMIVNRGDGDIYFGVNQGYDPDNLLESRETVEISFKRNNIYFISLKALADTTIRIWAIY